MNVEWYLEAGRLCKLDRAGYVLRGIDDPQSVADHSFRAALIAYDLAKAEGEDPTACAAMMLFHDLPEVEVGDITPHDGVSKEDKHAREFRTAKRQAHLSGNPEYFDIIKEYAEQKTLRAKICKDADLIEALTTVLEYSLEYPEKRESFQEFWIHARAHLSTPSGLKMFEDLFARKREMMAQGAPQILAAEARP